MRTLAVSAALGAAFIVAGCGKAAPRWHVAGGFLRAPDGRAVILRGVNLSGTQKNAPYLDDKSAGDYARVRTDWGMNAIRFVMTWSAVEPDEGRYDDAYLDAIAARMQWADAAGLAVVLDMHEDVYGEGFGFDGAPRWTCEQARYDAFMPQMPWFVNTLDPNVEACVDGFYTRADLQAALRRGVAARRRAARQVAGDRRVRRAQRARVGLVLDLRLRAGSADADVPRGRGRGARSGAGLGRISRAVGEPQRRHRHRADGAVRLCRRDVFARTRTISRPKAAAASIRRIASRSSTTSPSSPARRARSTPAYGSASTAAWRRRPASSST